MNQDQSAQMVAEGSFTVKLQAVPLAELAEDQALGRRTLNKVFSGALDATSQGEMLSAGGLVPGSAGYVAIERVTGTLAGRSGSFILQHSGRMVRGVPSLEVSVVPDSGTGELMGLQGSMTIRIDAGQHYYTFHYHL